MLLHMCLLEAFFNPLQATDALQGVQVGAESLTVSLGRTFLPVARLRICMHPAVSLGGGFRDLGLALDLECWSLRGAVWQSKSGSRSRSVRIRTLGFVARLFPASFDFEPGSCKFADVLTCLGIASCVCAARRL